MRDECQREGKAGLAGTMEMKMADEGSAGPCDHCMQEISISVGRGKEKLK